MSENKGTVGIRVYSDTFKVNLLAEYEYILRSSKRTTMLQDLRYLLVGTCTPSLYQMLNSSVYIVWAMKKEIFLHLLHLVWEE